MLRTKFENLLIGSFFHSFLTFDDPFTLYHKAQRQNKSRCDSAVSDIELSLVFRLIPNALYRAFILIDVKLKTQLFQRK
jgi:hypothetical protein